MKLAAGPLSTERDVTVQSGHWSCRFRLRRLRQPGLLIALCVPLFAQVHLSPMAGHWFPSDPGALTQLLDASYAASARRSPGPARQQLLGLVVPHAGLQYSGTVAASAYRLLGKPANIIVLAFPHRYPLAGIAIPKVDAYTTPLGEVKVNRAVAVSLGFPELDEKTLCDHSLENQLPFLQRSTPHASIVPLYVGTLDARSLQSAARKLAARVQQGDVIVASSDFTHYGASYGHTPFPNDARIADRLRDRAREAYERIGSLSIPFFDRFLSQTGDTICGRDPVRLLMATLAALSKDIYMVTADSMGSGDLLRDYSTSVTYGSLAFYPVTAFEVGEPERRHLLSHSRATLNRRLSADGTNANGFSNGTGARETDTSAALDQRTGVFVTIRKNGQLRGCIGELTPDTTLPVTVASRTLAAAGDPRFPRLSAADGPVTLEVSLLTPLKRLPHWKAYRAGLGGVLALDGRVALLLPQVAREMNWTPQQFLANLAQKAGLSPSAYRNPNARLYVFSAQVFGE
jgi:AmmeMemoRadiSam system protein B/AmmeMemoRadiSam system protein A